MEEKVLIVVPARMGSTRLANKPLALINKDPMIVHVWRWVEKISWAKVIVACDHELIAKAIEEQGGTAVLTSPNLATGSDRVAQACQRFDPKRRFEIVINVQGDLPYFSADLFPLLPPFQEDPSIDMVTFAHPFQGPYQMNAPQAVKVSFSQRTSWGGYCDNFSRTPIETDHYHIGVYAFRRKFLEEFSHMPQGIREKTEQLEQLRALEGGAKIAAVCLENESFFSIDTQQDLDYVCANWQKAS